MTIDRLVPSLDEIKEWENEFFDDDQNFDVMLIKAYQAGYQACEARYEAAMSDIISPTDLEVDDD